MRDVSTDIQYVNFHRPDTKLCLIYCIKVDTCVISFSWDTSDAHVQHDGFELLGIWL